MLYRYAWLEDGARAGDDGWFQLQQLQQLQQ
jgi:hypothetical protein